MDTKPIEDAIAVLRGEIAREAERFRAMAPRTVEHARRLQCEFDEIKGLYALQIAQLQSLLPPKPVFITADGKITDTPPGTPSGTPAASAPA